MLATWIYRLLLLAYPPSLRRAHGLEMTTTFAERWRDARSLTLRAGLAASLAADFMTSLPREWRAALGHPTRRGHGQRRGLPTTHLLGDFRSAARLFARAPLFALGAVVTLGLGIGATTAVFSLADATLVRPLPIEDPGEVYQSAWTWSHPDYRAFERDQQVFATVAAWTGVTFALEADGQTRTVVGLGVTGAFFELTGLHPVAGRFLNATDDQVGAPAAGVVSERLWRRSFGADPGIIGRTIRLSQRPVTVVGIAPAAFRGFSLNAAPEVFVAVSALPQVATGFVAQPRLLTARDSVYLNFAGRLANGASAEAAAADVMQSYMRGRTPNPNRIEEPVVLEPVTARAIGLQSSDDLRRFLFLLIGATAAGLLLACTTVANLLLVRTRGRQRELAIRAALGGGRRRLAQLLLTESLMIGLAGGVVGVAAAHVTLAMLASFSLPGNIAVADLNLGVDARLLALAVGAGLVTSVTFGAAPVWQTARVSLRAALVEGSRGSERHPLRAGLVGVQVAVCVVLLAGGLAFGRALSHALAMDLGFNSTDTALVSINPSLGRVPVDRATRFHRDALETVRSSSGVSAAAWSRLRPLRGNMMFEVSVPGDTRPRSRDIGDRTVVANTVSDGYFATMGIPLLAGRVFSADDTAARPLVAIASEAMATRYWPDQNPIGRLLKLDIGQTVTIVGVVGDVQRNVATDRIAMLYLPWFQQSQVTGRGEHYLMVRSGADDPAAVAAVAAGILTTTDARVPITSIETMREHLAGALMAHRLGVTLFGLFALLAALLTGLGLYAVIAYGVANRRREIGIRVALGATRSSVLALTARQGLVPIIGGLGAVTLLFLLSTGLVEGFMFALPAFNVLTAILIGAALAGLAGLAMYVPARRALAIDPTVALRDS